MGSHTDDWVLWNRKFIVIIIIIAIIIIITTIASVERVYAFRPFA